MVRCNNRLSRSVSNHQVRSESGCQERAGRGPFVNRAARLRRSLGRLWAWKRENAMEKERAAHLARMLESRLMMVYEEAIKTGLTLDDLQDPMDRLVLRAALTPEEVMEYWIKRFQEEFTE